MSNFIKQPSIQLLPSDPTTNTLLIICCVSGSATSLPYKAAWRKLNLKNNRVEEIGSGNGSSYRCSPLDLDCLIEATVTLQHQNARLSRVVQSNIVKISRELKERKLHYKQPILARLSLQEIALDCRLFVHDGAINVTTASNTVNLSYRVMIRDIGIEVEGSQLVFKLIFKENMDIFLEFIGQVLGWRLETGVNCVLLTFGSDLNRDIILLGVAEYRQKIEKVNKQPMNVKVNDGYHEISQTSRIKELEKEEGHTKNKGHTYSPSGAYNQKAKLAGKLVVMKRSFTKGNTQKPPNSAKFEQSIEKPESTTEHKLQNKDSLKERQFLNVFQEDEMQLLGPHQPVSFQTKPQNGLIRHEPEIISGQPSMHLRGSFDQFERSFNSHLKEVSIDPVFKIQNTQPSKWQNEITRLLKQNQQLKQQNYAITSLVKQNKALKQKQQQLKEEISRVQMQRKVIQTDKIRCQVNWQRQTQLKQQMKKELEYLRELVKCRGLEHFGQERAVKTQGIHDLQALQSKLELDRRQGSSKGRDFDRSPNSSFHR